MLVSQIVISNMRTQARTRPSTLEEQYESKQKLIIVLIKLISENQRYSDKTNQFH